VPPTSTPTPERTPDADALQDLTGRVWEWERFLDGDGSAIEIQDPSRYTLILNPDGTYQVRADCNRSGGAYTLDGGSLALLPGPTTLAECEPGSLYNAFLAHLGNVRTFVIDGDRLALDLLADAGQMTFRPVQPVHLPEVASGLVGITWEWVRFLGGDDSRIEVSDPARYTLTLNADGTYQIKADCNTSVGAYTWDEAHLTLEPGPTTLAECAPGSLYSDFLAKLGHVRTYVFDDGQLVLDLWADAGQMVFRRAEGAPAAPSLEGTLWGLVGYTKEGILVDVLPGSAITAELREGQIAGSAGCNRYTASFTVDGDALALGPVASTRMMCSSPDGIMEQEQGYLAALGSASAYQIAGDRLDMFDADGTLVATFAASTAEGVD
jgi:heat shock protein HslJ